MKLLKVLFTISLLTSLSSLTMDQSKKDCNESLWTTHAIDAARGLAGGITLFIMDNSTYSSVERSNYIRNTILGINLINILLDSNKSLKPSILGFLKRVASTFISYNLAGAFKKS